jgi:hypothetical protein
MKISIGRFTADRVLLLGLAAAAVLAFYGIGWGRVESWNPDEMALRSVYAPDRAFLEPQGYDKPPFHTYFNFFLSKAPLRALEKTTEVLTGVDHDFSVAILMWSRVLQLALFLGIVWLSYRIAERSSGILAARLIAIVTATSAGFVLQSHFLTADIPVTFWMLAAFLFAQSIVATGRMRDYVLAGLLTGIATATKYNGLAVGLAIPIFHAFVNQPRPLLKLAFDPRLVLGVGMVVIGFILASPYSVLRWSAFISDFIYNNALAPVYAGQGTDEHGYVLFFARVVEIIGLPVAILCAVGIVVGVARVRQMDQVARATVTAALGVFFLYFWKFGGFPRLEVRFVVPVVPLLLIAAVPGWSTGWRRYRVAAASVLGVLVAYNLVASIGVSHRFANDPRMDAQRWVAANVPAGARVESTSYTPYWNKLPGVRVEDVKMPHVSFRRRVLAQVLKADPKVAEMILARESDEGVEWFNRETLARRQPDFVVLNSVFFRRFLEGVGAEYYPEIRLYLVDLMAGRLGYEVVFDKQSARVPIWLYPEDIVFVTNRVVILKRNPLT